MNEEKLDDLDNRESKKIIKRILEIYHTLTSVEENIQESEYKSDNE